MSSLTKAVITGKVIRNPEKRFTNNNLPITTFAINIGSASDEKIVRVFAVGKLGETAEETIKKDIKIVVEGKLQTATVKTDSGLEKKIVEINAQNIEILGVSSEESAESSESYSGDFDFGSDESVDELIGEDEIPF